MVTYVQNKLIKVTIIVDISMHYRVFKMRTVCVQRVSNALFICTLRSKHAVQSLSARDVFHNPDSNCFFYCFYGWTLRRLCVNGTNLDQRKHNEFRACNLLVPNVRLALVWRFSDVYIHTWKNAHIFEHADNVRRGWRTQQMNDIHQASSLNHQRIMCDTGPSMLDSRAVNADSLDR